MQAETTQEKPTQPRPVDAAGRELDEHGLPLCGPARDRALEALGRPDPHVEPDAWPATNSANTETENG